MKKDSKNKTEKPSNEVEGKAEAILSKEILIRVPVRVMDFLAAHVKNPEEYIQNAVLRQFQGDLESDQYFYAPDRIIKLYNLAPIFQELHTANKKED